MAANPPRPRVPFDQRLNRDLIQQTAYYFFSLRVVLGVAAWVYYNEYIQPDLLLALPIHLLFVVYLGGNSIICLKFRSGEISRALLRLDFLLNIGTASLVTAITGGLRSPMGVIVLVKIVGYVLVYGLSYAFFAALWAMVIMVVVVLGNEAEWWQTAALPQLDSDIDDFFRLGLLAASLVGAPWLLRQIDRKDRQLQVEVRRARAAVQRERAAHAVSRAILAVNQAVSRATRLSDVLGKVVDVTPQVLGVDYCGIFLWNPDEGVYRGAMVSGTDAAVARQFPEVKLTPEDVPDFEWVRQLGHCAVVAARGIARLGLPEARTLLMAPLRSGDRFFGVLQFGRRDGHDAFTQSELLVSDGIAAQTAVAIERAHLVEESRRFGHAIDSTGEAVLITNRRGRIVYANEAFLRLFRITWPELKGRDSFEYATSSLPAEELKSIQREVSELGWSGEAIGRRSDDSTFPMLVNVSTIRGAEDPFQGIVAVITDMSSAREFQEYMQRADRLAAAGQMASGVAHEINNALVGILSQTELVRDSNNPAELHHALGLVERQGQRISDVVQQLLRFARPRSPERHAVDLREIVRETLDLVAAECRHNHVQCRVDAASVPPVVLADAKQIQQVLVNLITNSIHAMQPKGGTLSVAIETTPSQVQIKVEDTGAGIAAEGVERVFDPFFSTKEAGTGLGLSVSYAIARAHGGDLKLLSTSPEGSTFLLSLPAVAQETQPRMQSALLVDDDAAVAETLMEMLRREGVQAQHVACGEDALVQAAQRTYDIIFLDVRLPDISGPDVYARLLAEQPEQARRVVFVTGGLWRGDGRGLREKLPPQPTLSKPCTVAQIREVLRLLRDRRAAA